MIKYLLVNLNLTTFDHADDTTFFLKGNFVYREFVDNGYILLLIFVRVLKYNITKSRIAGI